MEKSFWEKVRAGKYKGEANMIRRAMESRARRIVMVKGPGLGRKSVIVKQVSAARSAEALKRVVRYIGRVDIDYENKGRKPEEKEAVLVEEAGTGARQTPAGERRGPAKDRAEAAFDETLPPRVFDEDGGEVDHRAIVERLAQWNLRRDAQNLTDAGQAALESGGWRAVDLLDEGTAFDEIQGRHIVISTEVPRGKRLAFEEVARQMVKETFGAWGYPALVAVHAEHGRQLHAHILVGTLKTAQTRLDSVVRRGFRRDERLTFDIQGFMADALREALGSIAREYGIEVDTVRREDRLELVNRVLAGEEELRPVRRSREWDEPVEIPGLDALPAMLRRLVRRVPAFVSANSEAIVRRMAEAERRRAGGLKPYPPSREKEPAARNAPMDDLRRLVDAVDAIAPGPGGRRVASIADMPPVAAQIAEALRVRRIYETPGGESGARAAVTAWQAMRREDSQFADWALVHAPFVFGETTQEAPGLAHDDEFCAAFRRMSEIEEETGAEIRFSRLVKSEPAMAGEVMRRAAGAALEALEVHPIAHEPLRIARQGQKAVSDTWTQLADAIEEAFDDDYMLKLAQGVREMAQTVRDITPIPTSGGVVRDVDDARRQAAERVQRADRRRATREGSERG